MRSAVVLPQPDGPSSTTKSPSGTSRSRSCSASDCSSKRLLDAHEADLAHLLAPRRGAGPVEARSTSSSPRRSSRPADVAALADAASSSSAARSPIATASGAPSSAGCGGGRPAACRRSRPPTRPAGRAGRRARARPSASIATRVVVRRRRPSGRRRASRPRVRAARAASAKASARRSAPASAQRVPHEARGAGARGRRGARRPPSMRWLVLDVDDAERVRRASRRRPPARRAPRGRAARRARASSARGRRRPRRPRAGRAARSTTAPARSRGSQSVFGDQHPEPVAPRAPLDALRRARRRTGSPASGTTSPSIIVACCAQRPRDGVRPVAELADRRLDPRPRRAGATGAAPRTTFDTVDFETPAWRATSLSVMLSCLRQAAERRRAAPSRDSAMHCLARRAPGPRARSRRRRRIRRRRSALEQRPPGLAVVSAPRRPRSATARWRGPPGSARRARRAAAAIRSGWSACPCRARSRSPRRARRSARCGSTPCHQKWLGSRFTPTFAPAYGLQARGSSRPRRRSRPGAARGRCAPRARVAAAQRESSAQIRPDVLAQLPVPEALVVAADRPDPEDAGAAAVAPAGAAAHRHDALDVEHRRELDRPAQRGLRRAARAAVGVQRVAGRVDGRERAARARRARRAARRARRAPPSSAARSRCGRGDHVPTPISTSVMPCSAHHASAAWRSR